MGNRVVKCTYLTDFIDPTCLWVLRMLGDREVYIYWFSFLFFFFFFFSSLLINILYSHKWVMNVDSLISCLEGISSLQGDCNKGNLPPCTNTLDSNIYTM